MNDVAHSYMVTEGLIGEQPVWRVVRREIDRRGMTSLVYVCGCPTLRAAMAIARALGAYREGEAPEVVVRESSTALLKPPTSENAGLRTKLWPVC